MVGKPVSGGVFQVEDVRGCRDQQAVLPGEHAGDLLQAVGENAGPAGGPSPSLSSSRTDAASGRLTRFRIVGRSSISATKTRPRASKAISTGSTTSGSEANSFHPEVRMNPHALQRLPGRPGRRVLVAGTARQEQQGTLPGPRAISEGAPCGLANAWEVSRDRRPGNGPAGGSLGAGAAACAGRPSGELQQARRVVMENLAHRAWVGRPGGARPPVP